MHLTRLHRNGLMSRHVTPQSICLTMPSDHAQRRLVVLVRIFAVQALHEFIFERREHATKLRNVLACGIRTLVDCLAGCGGGFLSLRFCLIICVFRLLFRKQKIR